MTIRELITKLADFMPDAEVTIGIRADWPPNSPINNSDVKIISRSQPHDAHGVWIQVNGESTEPNAFRRGALEQLFDEVSTGVSPEELQSRWDKFADELMERDNAQEAAISSVLEKHFDLLLEEAVVFVTNALLSDWPDEGGIREQANERYWARLEDELHNTPVEIPGDVLESASTWDVFIGLVFDRAHKAVKAARGD